MPFRTPQPISKPPKCPPAPRPQPTQPQLPSPPHYALSPTPTPTPPFFATLAARLAYTSEPRFLPNGQLTRPDPMPGYIPVHRDDRLPVHPRPASILSWKSGRSGERRLEGKSDSAATASQTKTTKGRVEKKKKNTKKDEEAGASLRHMELVMRPKSDVDEGQEHPGWHPCEHTAAAEREQQQQQQQRSSEASNGNMQTPHESGRVDRKGETCVRCTCCGREYQAKSPAELKPNTKLGICRGCGSRMGVEHGETEETEL